METVPYVESVLNPNAGCAYIPDDKIFPTHVRTETVTANLNVGIAGQANASGLIIIYPLAPGSHVGDHYKRNNAGDLIYDQAITTAQDLSQSYDYGRLVSGIVDVRSTTLPAGFYTINGTMNAILYNGNLSEIEDLSYDSILQTTSNNLDKVGNVGVTTGITVLSIPNTVDKPYTRLNDVSPSTGDHITNARINDDASSLVYRAGAVTNTPFIGGASKTVLSMNLDTTLAANFQGVFEVTDPPAAAVVWIVSVEGLDISGTAVQNCTETYNFQQEVGHGEASFAFTGSFPNLGDNDTLVLEKPLSAIRVSVSAGVGTATVVGVNLTATAIGASQEGTCNPVSIIAYENMTVGSVLTVAGVKNFQLIPNPVLARNVPTSYTAYNPAALNYLKQVLSVRNRIGIRSIWASPDYDAWKVVSKEVGDIGGAHPVAGSWGFGDILDVFKDGAQKLGGALLDTGVKTLSRGIGSLAGLAASGMPVARSASGRSVGRNRGFFNQMLDDGYAADMDIAERVANPLNNYLSPGKVANHFDFSGLSTIMMEGTECYRVDLDRHETVTLFPVVLSTSKTLLNPQGPKSMIIPSPSNTAIYACISGSRLAPLIYGGTRNFATTQDGFKVFGYDAGVAGSPVCNFSTGGDACLVPFKMLTDKVIFIPKFAPRVAGRSCDLAIYMTGRLTAGVHEMVFSGTIESEGSTPKIGPVSFFEFKKRAANKLGLKIMGNDAKADFKVEQATEALQIVMSTEYSASGDQNKQLSLKEFVRENPAMIAYSSSGKKIRTEEGERSSKKKATQGTGPESSTYTDEDNAMSDEESQKAPPPRAAGQKSSHVDTDSEEEESTQDEESSYEDRGRRKKKVKNPSTIPREDQAALDAYIVKIKTGWNKDKSAQTAIKISAYLERTGLTNELWSYIQRNPAGLVSFIRNSSDVSRGRIDQSTIIEYVRDGYKPKDFEPGSLRDMIASVYELSDRLRKQAPYATPLWIARNGGEGPDAVQAQSYRLSGVTPEPKLGAKSSTGMGRFTVEQKAQIWYRALEQNQQVQPAFKKQIIDYYIKRVNENRDIPGMDVLAKKGWARTGHEKAKKAKREAAKAWLG